MARAAERGIVSFEGGDNLATNESRVVYDLLDHRVNLGTHFIVLRSQVYKWDIHSLSLRVIDIF